MTTEMIELASASEPLGPADGQTGPPRRAQLLYTTA